MQRKPLQKMKKAQIKNTNLLNLPLLAMEQVTFGLEIVELIQLSRCSKRCANVISRCRLAPKYMEIEFSDVETTIKLGLQKEAINPIDVFKWAFPENVEAKTGKKKQQNGTDMAKLVVKKQNKITFVTGIMENRDMAVANVISHILQIFPTILIRKLDISRGKTYEENQFKIRNALAPVEKAMNFEISRKGITKEDVHWILENIEFSDSIYDRYYGHEEGHSINTRLIQNTKNYACFNCEWMTSENFLSLKSETMELYGFIPSPNVFRNFLLRWKESKDQASKNFKWLKIGVKRSENRVDLTKSLKGIKTLKWSSKRRGKEFEGDYNLCCRQHMACMGARRTCEHYIDCSKGVDIESDSGLLGTVVQDIQKGTFFLVWHDRFPKKITI